MEIRSRRGFGMVALTLLAAMMVSACGSKPAATSQSSQPAQSQTQTQPITPAPAPKPKDVKKITLANAVTPPNMIHIPMYVALDQGFFKEEGLDAQIISLEGGVGAARALASKSVDVAGTSADPLMAAVAAGGGIVGIYTYAPRVTNAMIGTPEVKTPADLKGKIIGIQEKNGFADVVSRLVLNKAGIKESDVKFVTTSTAGRLPALLSGQTNTAILHIEQVYKAMQDNPNLNYVQKLWETDPLWWYSTYAVNTDALKADPDLFERFVRAIVTTTRWMYKPENKDRVIEIYMKYNKGFDKATAEKAYDDIVKGKQWPVNEGVSKEIVDHTVKAELEIGIFKADKPPTYEQLYDRTIIDKVLKEMGRLDGYDL